MDQAAAKVWFTPWFCLLFTCKNRQNFLFALFGRAATCFSINFCPLFCGWWADDGDDDATVNGIVSVFVCRPAKNLHAFVQFFLLLPFSFFNQDNDLFLFFVFLLLDYSKHYFNDHSCFLPCFVLLINILISRTTKVSQLSWPRGEREEIISIKLLWIMSNA